MEQLQWLLLKMVTEEFIRNSTLSFNIRKICIGFYLKIWNNVWSYCKHDFNAMARTITGDNKISQNTVSKN